MPGENPYAAWQGDATGGWELSADADEDRASIIAFGLDFSIPLVKRHCNPKGALLSTSERLRTAAIGGRPRARIGGIGGSK